MTELSTRNSFIVRVYHYDTEEQGKVMGVVEVIDGKGDNTPFRDTGELGSIIDRFLKRRKKAKANKNEAR